MSLNRNNVRNGLSFLSGWRVASRSANRTGWDEPCRSGSAWRLGAVTLAAMLLFGGTRPVQAAGAGQWVSNGPPGGEVRCLAGNDKGVLYAGTTHGVFVSSDGGATWVDRSAGMGKTSVTGIALDSAGNAAASTIGGLFRKPADQTDWQTVGAPGFYASMVVDKAGNFYAGSYHSGVMESTDHGATWKGDRVATDVAPAIYAVAVDGSGTVYAGTRRGIYVHTAADALGVWTPRPLPDNAGDIAAITIAQGADGGPADNGAVYVGTGTGNVYSSANAGQEWTPVSNVSFSSPVSGLLAAADGTLYMANSQAVWLLNRDSASWTRANKYQWAPANTLLGIGSHILAGTGNGVLSLGETGWSILSAGMNAHSVRAIAAGADNAVFAATRGGLYRSTDAGATWLRIGFTRAYFECLAVGPNNVVYAGTRSEGDSAPTGVLRSIDGGEHWTSPANNGLPLVTISALVVSPDAVYAATGRGLFKSTDTGENWTEADTGLGAGAGPVGAVTMLPDGTLFAGSRDGIFKSADKGATWTAVNNGLKSAHAEFLAVSPDGVTLYANSGPNIYRSADKGTTWEFRSQAPNDSAGPLQIAPGAGNIVYVADRQTGVWASTDGGGTWAPLSAGLGTPQVLSLALSATGRLYAGTNGASVWQMSVKGP